MFTLLTNIYIKILAVYPTAMSHDLPRALHHGPRWVPKPHRAHQADQWQRWDLLEIKPLVGGKYCQVNLYQVQLRHTPDRRWEQQRTTVRKDDRRNMILKLCNGLSAHGQQPWTTLPLASGCWRVVRKYADISQPWMECCVSGSWRDSPWTPPDTARGSLRLVSSFSCAYVTNVSSGNGFTFWPFLTNWL